MVNVLYSVVAVVALAVLFLLFQYHKTNKDKSTRYRSTNLLMWCSIAFCATDAVWGIIGTGYLGKNISIFWAASFAFHTMASATAYIWYRYTVIYLEYKENKIATLATLIPLVTIAVLMIISIVNDGIYYIDDDFVYHSGKLRSIIFCLQYVYFLIGLFRALIKMLTAKSSFQRSRFNTVIISLLIPMGTGVFQLWFPDAPCYSIGYMLSAVAVFTGNISIERESSLKESTDKYKTESAEIYKALQSLAKNFVSIHLFDLILDKQNMVHSDPKLEFFVRSEDTAREQLRKVMVGIAEPSVVADVVQFVDTYTLPERLKNKNSISFEFLTKDNMYYVSNFYVAERDSKGEVTKVVHAIQNITEVRRKEIEYEKAIKEALENENAVYTELLQMLDTGVIATDEERNLVVFNQKMKKIMGKSRSKITSLEDLVSNVHYEKEEETLQAYKNIRKNGGSYEYYFWTQSGDAPRTYCLAFTKRIELKNKKRYIVTSVADVTRSKEMEKELIVLSETDALTGINNRGSGEAKIDANLTSRVMGMFCIFDADNFKSINDSFGHTVGDAALIAIADCMKAAFRDKDIIMRLGGDEFAVYAVGIDNQKKAVAVIDRFFEKIEEVEIPEMNDRKITVSLGAVFADKNSDFAFDDLYKKADSVMYESKRENGNSYRFY